MTKSDIQKLSSLSSKAQGWLKAELIRQLKLKSYRDLSRITGLNLKIIKSIIDGKGFPKTESLVKACQGLLDNSSKPTKPKKRRE
jgi:hypothetical protein